MMMRSVMMLLVLCSALSAAEESRVPAIAVEKAGAGNGGNYVVGYRFTLEQPMTITDLGVTDQNADGTLNGVEPVKVVLWDVTGEEIVAAEVPLTAAADGGAFYAGIPPLKLEAASYVIGAGFRRDGERFSYDSQARALPGVRWEEGRFETGTSVIFPEKIRPQPNGYFGPVFKVIAGAAGRAAANLRVDQPAERAIFQRNDRHTAEIPIACTAAGTFDALEVRALDRRTQQSPLDWHPVSPDPKDGIFRCRLPLATGWYRIEFRASLAGAVVGTAVVERVGVGEVFVTCGQSNSANYGRPPQRPQDDRVSSCDFQSGSWRHADDPQRGAGGGGGSPWPILGDLLAERFDTPVGFICIGVGSTPVAFWTPSEKGYLRIKKALEVAGSRGIRAILWHQGESDSLAATSADDYAEMLGQTIAQSRQDAGWSVPWGVALASFHPSAQATEERQFAVVNGQKKVIAQTPDVFLGPATDSFRKQGWLGDGVHFNAEGLAAHARGWADAVAPLLENHSTTPRKEGQE